MGIIDNDNDNDINTNNDNDNSHTDNTSSNNDSEKARNRHRSIDDTLDEKITAATQQIKNKNNDSSTEVKNTTTTFRGRQKSRMKKFRQHRDHILLFKEKE